MMKINVMEIRNYVLQPHMTQHFIDNFEANFITTLEAAGMAVLGQFRVMDAPDRFVWLRGYPDMEARRVSLHAFYDGPVWQKLCKFTNSMLVDSDHVHLLRPCGETSALLGGVTVESVAAELAAGTISSDTGLIVIDFYHAQHQELIEQVREVYQGVQVRGVFVSEMQPNTYPRLPVIQDPDLVVVISAYPDEAALHEQRARLTTRMNGLVRADEALILGPTLRSPLRYMGR